jgi:hypothetical protein
VLPNYSEIGREPVMPKGEAENEHRVVAGGKAFVRSRQASQFRLQTQHGEEIGADVGGRETVGAAIGLHTVHAWTVGEHVGEGGRGSLAHVLVFRIGEHGQGRRPVLRDGHGHHPVRVGDGQRTEEQRIHHGENGGIKADA